MADLLSGGRVKLKNLKWKRFKQSFENLLTNNIYYIKNSDISQGKSPRNESDINLDRFNVISNEGDIISSIDKLIAKIKGVSKNKKGRESVLIRLIEVQIKAFYNLDIEAWQVLEGAIVDITEELHDLMINSNGSYGGVRDVPVNLLSEASKKSYNQIVTIFTKMIENILLQHADLSKKWKEDKQMLSEEEFTQKLDDFNINEILEPTVELQTELINYKEPVVNDNDDELQRKNEEIRKLKESQEKLSVVVNEQNARLMRQNEKIKNMSDGRPAKKRKVSQHLRSSLEQLQSDASKATTESIMRQINGDSENKNDDNDIEILEKDQDNDQDIDLDGWIQNKLPDTKGTELSDRLSSLGKKVERLSKSGGVITDDMMSMVATSMCI